MMRTLAFSKQLDEWKQTNGYKVCRITIKSVICTQEVHLLKYFWLGANKVILLYLVIQYSL